MSLVRQFSAAANDNITLGLGALGFAFAPGTIAVLCYPQDVTTYPEEIILSAGTSGAGRYSFYTNLTTTDHRLTLQCDTGSTAAGPDVSTMNHWYLIAVSLASSGGFPRFHVKDLTAAGAWNHVNSVSTALATGVPVTRGRIGNDPGNAAPFHGRIAVAGVWNSVLSDAQIEALPNGLTFWQQPSNLKGLWRLDQSDVAILVPDLSGGGANESSHSGTSVISTTIDGWTEGPRVDVLVGV